MQTSSNDQSGNTSAMQAVFDALNEPLKRIVNTSDGNQELEPIDYVLASLNVLNQYWTNFCNENPDKRADFYSDDFLGYHTCQYISAKAQDLVESDEYSVIKLTEALITYLHLDLAYKEHGDITKRIEEALESLVNFESNIQEMIATNIDEILEGKIECPTPEVCNEIGNYLSSPHEFLLKSLKNIALS